MLGIPISFTDMEAIDPTFYRSLCDLQENPVDDLGVDLTFTANVDDFGEVREVELKPGGADIEVTDDNKAEYVRLLTRHRMTSAIRPQIDAFLSGFHEMCPVELINVFTPSELELLISGTPEIDVDDMQANTTYHGGYNESHRTIRAFWSVVRTFSQAELALLVQFITGTSKIPLDGFASLQGMRGPQKVNIHRAHGNGLCTAHTCFNQLDLPDYGSRRVLREKLLLAIKEGGEGFGFV